MEDWLKSHISALVKYRQNQKMYMNTFISWYLLGKCVNASKFLPVTLTSSRYEVSDTVLTTGTESTS